MKLFKFILVFIIAFASVPSLAQNSNLRNPTLEILAFIKDRNFIANVDNQKPLNVYATEDGVKVNIKKTLSKNNDYIIYVPLNVEYEIYFEREGYITAMIEVNSFISKNEELDDYTTEVNVRMIKQPNDGTLLRIDRPVAKIEYVKEFYAFDVLWSYEDRILPQLNKLEKQVVKLDRKHRKMLKDKHDAYQEELAKLQEKEEIPTEKAKKIIEEKRIKDEKELAKKKAAQAAAYAKAEEEKAAKEEEIRKEKLAKQKEEEERQKIIEEERKKAEAILAKRNAEEKNEINLEAEKRRAEEKEARRKAAIAAHQLRKRNEKESDDENVDITEKEIDFDDSEQREQYLSALAKKYGDGIHRETITEKQRVINKIVVVKEGTADEYRKISYSWGGIYFFKNGKSITSATFNAETKD